MSIVDTKSSAPSVLKPLVASGHKADRTQSFTAVLHNTKSKSLAFSKAKNITTYGMLDCCHVTDRRQIQNVFPDEP